MDTLAGLGRAAGEVAHDVDNALAAIVMHASVLRGLPLPAAASPHVEAILRAARAAGDVVERVRGRLRPRSGPEPVVIDLAALVEDALVPARVRAAGRTIRVERVGAAPRVRGVRAELLQLVTNLVNNAVDASPEGGRVEVRLDEVEGQAVLVVRDQGAGIPAPLLERVFEPFFTTKGAAGTGLGLALARSIATSHGGELALASHIHGPERGTIARVTLPLAAGEPSRAVATDLGLDTVAAASRGARVLLVDDDRDMREALAVLCEAAGFEVAHVGTLPAAFAEVEARPPAVVVTDLQLGPDDGAALVRHLAALGVPVVVMSGAAHDGPWRELAAAVFDKPASPARLLARLAELTRPPEPVA